MPTQPTPPIALDAVAFDCDGTLSTLEGIVELARWHNMAEKISQLTEQAMSSTGLSPKLYQQRINAVRPSRSDCQRLAQDYYTTRSHGIDTVLAELHRQNIATFIISAGVNPAVSEFGQQLQVKGSFAVDLQFSADGQYLGYDQSSPMTQSGGKRQIIAKLKQHYPRIGYVGDGQNDLDVLHDVDCFVGYGGAYYRPAIEQASPNYIREASLLPLLDYFSNC